MADRSDRLGDVVADSYRLVRVLGEGGMGTVYEAQHLRLQRRFAVKILKPEVASNAEMFERFRREAEIATASRHENVVEVIDFNVGADGVPYIVMEFLEGETLGARISRRGQLSLEETASIVEQAASALEATHERGVVHRDLKPQNILLIRRGKRDDSVKILDFGISKVLHDPSMSTGHGTLLGTPNYMAPEQLTGMSGDIDRRADVWALGAIAYECLTGQLAFSGPTIPGTLYQVCHAEPRPLRELAPEAPAEVIAVVRRALEKSRENRFSTADELGRAFLAAVGRPVAADTNKGLPTMPPEAKIVVRASKEMDDASAPTMADRSGQHAAVTPATLGTSSREIGATRTGASKRTIVLGGLGAAAVATALIVWLGGDRGRSPSDSTTARSNDAVSVPIAASATTTTAFAASAPPATIEVRVHVVPPNATILLDGVATVAPIHLPRGVEKHVLILRAPGFVDVTREIGTDADTDLVVQLDKDEHAIKSKPPPLATKTAATSTTAPPAATATTAPTGKVDIKGPMEKDL